MTTATAATSTFEPGDDLIADATGLEPVSLAAKDIHLTFGGNEVLRGVDIDVPRGHAQWR